MGRLCWGKGAHTIGGVGSRVYSCDLAPSSSAQFLQAWEPQAQGPKSQEIV